MDEKSSNQYCQNLVRVRDYNRYLLSFFVPRQSRASLLAIMALNVELQSIPDKANDPMAALIRLQWWRDAIDAIYLGKDIQTSPIFPSLERAIHTHKIPKQDVESLMICYDDIIRGTPKDPDDDLYGVLSSVIPTPKARNRFSKKLQFHDNLDDETPFRALRLLTGI